MHGHQGGMLRQTELRFSQRGTDWAEGEIRAGPRHGPRVWGSRRHGNTGKMSCVSIRTPPSQGLKSKGLKHQVREESKEGKKAKARRGLWCDTQGIQISAAGVRCACRLYNCCSSPTRVQPVVTHVSPTEVLNRRKVV